MSILKYRIALMTIAIVLMSSNVTFAQTRKYLASEETLDSMLQSIPTKDGKIFFDEVITVDSSLKKEQLFIKIRQWFVENFSRSTAVLEVNDLANGILIGKGTYEYSNINGLNAHTGYTIFIMNVAVKDGKFRYQLYNFVSSGTNKSLLSNTYYRGHPESINLDRMLVLYHKGERKKLTSQYLNDMDALVYFIQMSLKDIGARSDINNF